MPDTERARGKRVWRGRAQKAALVIASVMLAAALFELATLLLLRFPGLAARMPGPLLRNVRRVYLRYDRPIVQYSPESSRFDPELLYTLKPGDFVQRAREFEVAYHANTLGVRDDEQSLVAPEIVVLGDSYAMGWGVGHDQAFPQLIEQLGGERVLDAGISSYGTVREMRLLDRIDTSHAKRLVIQYCSNDLDENLPFLQNGALDPPTRRTYRWALEQDAGRRRYWFGKYLWTLVHPPATEAAEPEVPPEVEARAFVNALLHAGRRKLDGLEIYVVAWENPAFTDALRAEQRRPDAPRVVRDLKVIALADRLRPEHYYVLDDHWNPSGHSLVADELLAEFGD